MTSEALDGGWGYVVAAAAFFVAFFLDGLENSFGVLLPYLVEEFDVGIAVVTFCGGLITGVCLGTGPVVAVLIKRFGCRKLAFGGGFVAAVSLAICTQAHNIAMFTVFYGVFAGCGLGMLYLPSITTVNMYFDKKRGVVIGLVTSGSGIGLFVMSLLIDHLISMYGWRGCYLILAGIYLNLCVCAALLRPLSSKINKSFLKLKRNGCLKQCREQNGGCDKEAERMVKEQNGSVCCQNEDIAHVEEGKECHKINTNGHCDGERGDISEKLLSETEDAERPKEQPLHQSFSAIPENDDDTPTVLLAVNEMRARANTASQADYKYTQIHPSHRSHASNPQIYAARSNSSLISALNKLRLNNRAVSSDLFKPALGQDRHIKSSRSSHLQGSLSVLNVPMEFVSMTSLNNDNMADTQLSSVVVRPNENGITTQSNEIHCGMVSSHTSVSQLSTNKTPPTNPFLLLKLPRFVLFCAGGFLTQVALVVPAMLTPSYAISLGIEHSDAAMVVSVLGIANTVGRFVAGLLAFIGIRSLRIYNTGIFLAGVTCFLIPVCTTHPALLAFAAFHGFFIGAFPPLQSVILVEQLGLHLLPASFGVLCLSKSFASVMGPTLAGALYSLFDDYIAPYFFTGGLLTIATILHGIMTYCPRKKL